MDPFKEAWYHGRISRQEAEGLLQRDGGTDGAFLLRDSLSITGEFVLSITYGGRKYHYQISRRQDKVAIEDGRKFDGPVELVLYHQQKADGLFVRLSKPICRRPGVQPRGYRFISHADMQKAMKDAAMQLGYESQQVQQALGYRRAAFEQLVGGILHKTQTWFHGNLSREESEALLRRFGLKDGSFLVRERVDANSYAICVAHKQKVYHYLLERNSDGLLSIQKGRKFENLLQVVDHYSRGPDGLLCSLGDPIPVASPAVAMVEPPGPKRINEADLVTTKELGHGSFGNVMQGTYRYPNGRCIDVAIKILKEVEALNPKHEIMREADTMSVLDHENIVRLIGIGASEPMKLVMELAPLGPLNKYLRKSQQQGRVTAEHVTNFLQQVAAGMAYLESVRFVHRDLAARNVLVVNEHFAKISDFGMSRAIGVDSNYYEPKAPGRWPLKWYAPECIYYSKFDSKSDVWSYGVTLWEGYSFGSKPYQGLKGPDILQMIEANQRLPKPVACPPAAYEIMLECWSYEPPRRPTFAELRERMKHV